MTKPFEKLTEINKEISAKFWRTVTAEEFTKICDTNRLEGAVLLRFWRIMEFQGEPPAALEIRINVRDFEKLYGIKGKA